LQFQISETKAIGWGGIRI